MQEPFLSFKIKCVFWQLWPELNLLFQPNGSLEQLSNSWKFYYSFVFDPTSLSRKGTMRKAGQQTADFLQDRHMTLPIRNIMPTTIVNKKPIESLQLTYRR